MCSRLWSESNKLLIFLELDWKSNHSQFVSQLYIGTGLEKLTSQIKHFLNNHCTYNEWPFELYMIWDNMIYDANKIFKDLRCFEQKKWLLVENSFWVLDGTREGILYLEFSVFSPFIPFPSSFSIAEPILFP